MTNVVLHVALASMLAASACGAVALPDDLASLVQIMNENGETRSVDATNKVWRTFGKDGLFEAARTGGPTARARAAFRLQDCNDGVCELELIRLLIQDNDTFVRTQAAWSLGVMGTPKAVPALRKAAAHDEKGLSQVARDAEVAIARRGKQSTTP